MTSREWFGLGVRLFALWPLFLAVRYGLSFIDVRMGFSPMRSYGFDTDTNPNEYLVIAFVYAGFAMFLLRCTSVVVGFAYPKRGADSTGDSGDTEEPRASAD